MKEYIDLGLPSGTLWCSENEEGYYTYDEAIEKFGDNLPTKEQWEELVNKCSWSRECNGYKVVVPNGNTIILPPKGYLAFDGVVYRGDTLGNYWSSSPYDSNKAWVWYFYSNGMCIDCDKRGFGFSVRLVKNNK